MILSFLNSVRGRNYSGKLHCLTDLETELSVQTRSQTQFGNENNEKLLDK